MTEARIRDLSKRIENRLEKLQLPADPGMLYDPVRYTLALPGKRVRPYLTLIGCGLCGGDVEEALNAAMAIELLHNFTLLHDDIMDSAETRRGEPSVFSKWDANTAILSGDAMYAKAFKELQYYGKNDAYSKQTYTEILDVFLLSAEKVCEGQAYDLMFETAADVTIENYLHMIEGKTAALISGALTIGGVVAGGNPDLIAQLRMLGKKTGIAFQIQDDLMDVTANPEMFGKRKGGDIIEGKKTYLSLLALKKGNEAQKQQLMSVINSETTSSDDVARITDLYFNLDVIKDAEEAVNRYYQSAVEHLEFFEPSTFKDEITEFLNHLISRKS